MNDSKEHVEQNWLFDSKELRIELNNFKCLQMCVKNTPDLTYQNKSPLKSKN